MTIASYPKKHKPIQLNYESHESIMSAFVTTVQEVIDDVKEKQEELKDNPAVTDDVRAFHTRNIILSWFRTNGGL
jgi:hypothetical protein